MLRILGRTSPAIWGSHIDWITCTAYKTLGFVKRNIRTKMSGVRQAAYTTLVRPQLEYAAAIWDPHHKDKIDQMASCPLEELQL